MKKRMVVWFSCGAASAVVTKLCLSKYASTHEIVIARCVVANEHPDNDRFAVECERWFNQKVIELRSPFYKDCWDVWQTYHNLRGYKGGSKCTDSLKRQPRKIFEKEWGPDVQVYGYTSEEKARATKFREANLGVELVSPLIDEGLKKADCLAMVERAGIEIPVMYRLGFNNNNCIGCVKGGMGYWNRIRVFFPKIFERMALFEREIGQSCIMQDQIKIWLDELNPSAGRHHEPEIDCSLFCFQVEQSYGAMDVVL